MESPIIIRYLPEKKDYIHASRALAMKTTSFLILAAVTILSVIAAAAVIVAPAIGNANWRNAAIIVLLVGLSYIAYYFILIPLQLSSAYKKHAYLQMEREYTFDDKQVLMKIGDLSTELQWENFQKVIDHRGFYLLVYNAGERVYPFIPGRAFEEKSSQALFRALLKEKSIPVV